MSRSFHTWKLPAFRFAFLKVERIDEYRMSTEDEHRGVLMADVIGGRVWGRPRLSWMDGVKMALSGRGNTVEAARQCAKDRKEWRALVHMEMIEFKVDIFTCTCMRSFGPPSRHLLGYHQRGGGVGCGYMMRFG